MLTPSPGFLEGARRHLTPIVSFRESRSAHYLHSVSTAGRLCQGQTSERSPYYSPRVLSARVPRHRGSANGVRMTRNKQHIDSEVSFHSRAPGSLPYERGGAAISLSLAVVFWPKLTSHLMNSKIRASAVALGSPGRLEAAGAARSRPPKGSLLFGNKQSFCSPKR